MLATAFTAPDTEIVPPYLRGRTIVMRATGEFLRDAHYKASNGEWCAVWMPHAQTARNAARRCGEDVEFI